MSKFIYKEIIPNKLHFISQNGDRESVDIKITFHAGGSWFEGENDLGKKHLMEHCIMASNKTMDHDQLKAWEQKNAISMNAFTSPLSMGMTAGGHKDDFKLIISTLLEMAFLPVFNQGDLDREKEIVLREISERRGDPNYQLYFDTQKELYVPGSFALHETLGDPALVEQTTLEDFYKMHKQNLENSQIILTISGGEIDSNWAMETFSNLYKLALEKNRLDLGKISPKVIDFQPKSEFQKFTTKTIIHPLAHQHCDVSIIIDCSVTLENSPTRSIFSNLYFQYGGSLYDRLRDEKQLVYGISTYFDTEIGALVINLQCEIEMIDQILVEAEDIFSSFQKYFMQERFEDYKNVVYKKQAMAKDSISTCVSFTKQMLVTYGKLTLYDDYTNILKTISIDQIQQVYDQIQSGWDTKKIIIVSKNKEIEKFSK